jgi:hypothetical protein
VTEALPVPARFAIRLMLSSGTSYDAASLTVATRTPTVIITWELCGVSISFAY